MASPGLRRLLVVLGLVVLGGSLLLRPAPAGAAADDRFTGPARLPGCAGAREVLVDKLQYKLIELLDGGGKVATTVRGTRLAYASMYRTDLAVYELRESYADLAAAGVTPLTLATEGPARGDEIRIPSGYWTEQRACTTTGTAYRVHEREWDWWRSIRLPAGDGCAIRGGYSGSPLISRETGLVVGIANTGYVGGRRCIDSACEENQRGRVVMRQDMNYGQQTWLLTTCVGADRRFDLSAPGCRLAKPRG
jgi:hypothetical protein